MSHGTGYLELDGKQGSSTSAAQLSPLGLTAGQSYSLRVAYTHTTSTGTATLQWLMPSASDFATVPASALEHTVSCEGGCGDGCCAGLASAGQRVSLLLDDDSCRCTPRTEGLGCANVCSSQDFGIEPGWQAEYFTEAGFDAQKLSFIRSEAVLDQSWRLTAQPDPF